MPCFERPLQQFITQRYHRCRSTCSKVYQRVGADRIVEYSLTDQSNILANVTDPSNSNGWHHRIFQILLPKGYPSSVEGGYLKYVQWTAVSSVSGTVCGCLSMQSLLFAAGIGAEASLPLAATMNWIIKDGLGQVGGILFASLVNNKFDTNPKYYRMLAAVSMELASFIELLLPLAPQYFLLGASISNIGKNIAFLASSASRAAIHKSFAKHNNLADITAKSGSQGIVCSLLGTSIGISLAALNQNVYMYTCSSFIVCAVVSVTATYFSLRHVTLTSLTIPVLDYILYHAIVTESSLPISNRKILSPNDIREMEVMLRLSPLPMRYSLNVNSDLSRAFQDAHHLRQSLDLFDDSNYIISIIHYEVHLIFKEVASESDMLLGFLHSFLIRHALQTKKLTDQNAILATKQNLAQCTSL